MVDCQENTIPFVRSYPTLLLYDSTGRPQNVDSSLAYLADASVPDNPQVSIVYFFVPWCGHCRATSPEVSAFERHLPGGQRVLRVNCEDNPEVASKRGVQRYPTLQIIANGRHTQHVGGITRQELTEFYQRSLQMLQRQ
jgi:thioredoxin 1